MSRPRIRTIKPELWQDEAIGHACIHARLLFVGLITMADDEGRLRALPAAIIGHVFPYDADVNAAKLKRWLEELQAAGLIVLYEANGTPYIQLVGWLAHQKINRATESKLPPPPGREPSVSDHGELTESSVSSHGGGTERSLPRARACAGADRIGSGKELPPVPPKGGRQRDRQRYDEQLAAYAATHFGHLGDEGRQAVRQAVHYGKAQTHDAVVAFIAEHWQEAA